MRPSTNGQVQAASENFARTLHNTWGVGLQSDCGGSGILLFLSKMDRSIYVSRGKAVESVLTNGRITQIVDNMKPLLQQEQYAAAILRALQEVDSYIRLGEPGVYEQAGEFAANYLGLGLIGVFFASALWGARQRDRQRREYTRVRSHLNSLDQQRAQALQGRFECKSCPICLEDFNLTSTSKKGSDGKPLKLLRCGHVFDESCWLDWVQSGNGQYDKCPICRTDVGAPRDDGIRRRSPILRPSSSSSSFSDEFPTPISSPTTQQRNARSFQSRTSSADARPMRLHTLERNFRLQQLGTRYPRFVRSHQIDHWTSSNFRGPIARDPSFTKLDPQRETIVGDNQHNSTARFRSSGSGFGGGQSSSGQGGRW